MRIVTGAITFLIILFFSDKKNARINIPGMETIVRYLSAALNGIKREKLEDPKLKYSKRE